MFCCLNQIITWPVMIIRQNIIMQKSIPQIPQPSRSNLTILLHSSLAGVLRGLAGLPLQHPFDNIKTNMQAYQTNFMKTFHLIYQRHGFLGLYSGFIVNSLRVAAKQFYRWPLQIGLFGFYRQIFNQKISRGNLGVICGINMALIQVGILCPFERMKVWLMTSSKHAKMRDFFKKLSFKALFDGVVPIFYKQLISWVTFLGATQFFKDIAYKYQNKDRFSEQLNHKQIMVVTGCVAVVNTFFVMPVDCIKTHFQKNQNSDENLSSMKKSHKFRNIVGQIYQKYGVKGFFKGWQIKLAQYTVNSLFTVVIFEKILKQYEKKIVDKRNQNQII